MNVIACTTLSLIAAASVAAQNPPAETEAYPRLASSTLVTNINAEAGTVVHSVVIAQVDKSSDAYRAGSAVGKIARYALLAAIALVLLQKILKK